MRPSPLLSAAAAAALVAAVAGPASAATPAPARGVASSSVTLLGVAAGGHTVTAGTLELLSDMLGADAVAKALLTPLTADGTAYGQQTVTSDSSPGSAPSVDTATLVPALGGIVGLRSPVLRATATSTEGQPATTAGTDSLGDVTVLGLPLSLSGSLDVGSAVTKAGGALGEQELVVEDVALPSVADLLAALGLDLSALPVEVLVELLEELDLVNDVVDGAQQALADATAAVQAQIDAAQAEVDAATAGLEAAQDELAAATAALAPLEQALLEDNAALDAAEDAATAANTQLTSAQQAASAASAEVNRLSLLGAAGAALLPAAQATLTQANGLVASATTAVTTTTAAVTAARSAAALSQAAVDAAEAVVALAQDAVDAAQAVLDAALALLNSILDTVQAELDALLGAITAVLDGTPLVSFDSLSVVTRSAATTNAEGGQEAVITGGELSGLQVLGTDVLSDVLGSSSVDLLDLVGGTLDDVTALVAELNGTLSAVLSSVPQFPTLSIPAPEVGLFEKSTSTGIADGFGEARTSLTGLSVTLPSVSIPTALALPGASALPALDGITQVAGLLTSAPIRVDLATLATQSRFAPAVVAAPTTGTPGTGTPGTATPVAAPNLPRTGAEQALAVLGVALMAAAVVARRRSADSADATA